MAKGIAWLKIKKDYLEGISPKELSEKYKVDIEKLYKKIENDKWAAELREIKGNIGNKVQDKIDRISNKALDTCEQVMDDKQASYKDKLTAANIALSVSGLKSSKQEISGEIEKIFITKKEEEQVQEHINDFING